MTATPIEAPTGLFRDFRLLVLSFLIPLVLPAAARGAEGVEPLFQAMREGKVRFEAVAMHGFEKIDITVTNLTDRFLRLDPAGAMLMPPDPSLQRLGLGAPVTADPENEDSFFILLPPRGDWSGTVWAVCLDHEKGVPPNGVPYALSASGAPDKALEILRYWARNPWIVQKTVNDIIWTGQDLGVLRSQVIPARIRRSEPAAWNGALYWRSGDGEIYRLREEEWTRIGKGFDAVSAAEGLVVGLNRAINGVRITGQTGEGWRFLSLPGIPDKALPAPGMAVFAKVEDRLFRFGPGQEGFEPVDSPPLLDFACSGESGEILHILEKGKGAVLRREDDGSWASLPGDSASRIAAGRGDLYAAFPSGVFRLRRTWVKIADPGVQFFPGRGSCFLVQEGKYGRYDESTSEVVFSQPISRQYVAISADPASDTLFLLDEKGAIHAFRGEGIEFVARVPGRSEK